MRGEIEDLSLKPLIALCLSENRYIRACKPVDIVRHLATFFDSNIAAEASRQLSYLETILKRTEDKELELKVRGASRVYDKELELKVRGASRVYLPLALSLTYVWAPVASVDSQSQEATSRVGDHQGRDDGQPRRLAASHQLEGRATVPIAVRPRSVARGRNRFVDGQPSSFVRDEYALFLSLSLSLMYQRVRYAAQTTI